jgi:hypothetical protein
MSGRKIQRVRAPYYPVKPSSCVTYLGAENAGETTVKFKMTSDALAEDVFTLNESTGMLTIAKALDRETRDRHVLTSK